jgi:hypothetical protein
MLDRLEESFVFLRIMPEEVAQDAEGPRRITEACGHLVRGEVVHEEASQRLVLSLEGGLGAKEELGLGRGASMRYCITSIYIHAIMMLSNSRMSSQKTP